MEATTAPITVDQYFAMTYEGDRTQLIDGTIVVNEPLPRHQLAQAQLLHAMLGWVEAGPGRGFVSPPINVVLGDRDVYGPDLVWYSDPERIDLDASRNPVPDLAVEIRSPSTWRYDVGTKKSRYEEHGLPELWLVDAESRSVLVYRRSSPDAPELDVALELGEGEALSSPQLPGFELPVARLFAAGRSATRDER
jgi:Uma2 family endonuclease